MSSRASATWSPARQSAVGAQARGSIEPDAPAGSIPKTQHAKVLSAELDDVPPDQVRAALGLDDGQLRDPTVRVTYEGDRPVSWSTSWFSGDVADVAPRLLETSRITEGTFTYLASALGRRVVAWQDQYDPDLANGVDADRLGVAEGTPVHRGQKLVLRRVWPGRGVRRERHHAGESPIGATSKTEVAIRCQWLFSRLWCTRTRTRTPHRRR